MAGKVPPAPEMEKELGKDGVVPETLTLPVMKAHLVVIKKIKAEQP